MRRLMLYLAVGVLVLLVGQAAFAANTVSVTVTLQQVGVDVTPTSWALGNKGPGSTTSSGTGGYFDAENTGNVNEDISIGTGLSSPSSWSYGTSSGENVYVMEVSTNGTDWTVLNPSTTLVSDLAPGSGAAQAFDLKFTCPNGDSTYDAGGEAITVTLSATAS